MESKSPRHDEILYVSFYTKNTPYEDEAKRLVESLDRFDLPHRVEGIDGRGSWRENACSKPRFIREALDRYSDHRAIVWLDADSVVLRYPKLFGELTDVDFAMSWRGKKRKWRNLKNYLSRVVSQPKYRGRILDLLRNTDQYRKPFSCVMYFRNCPEVRKLIDDWIEISESGEAGPRADQGAIDLAMRRGGYFDGRLRIRNLPARYARKEVKRSDATVILQTMASERVGVDEQQPG